MNYCEVVNDIIIYYEDFVTENEMKVLDKLKNKLYKLEDKEISDEIVLFINRIIDRIWNLTLTNVDEYTKGEDFTFLVKETRYWVEDGKIIDVVIDDFKLLTNETITKTCLDEVGVIISPNFTNNLRTTPILPIHLKDKNKHIRKFNYDVVGYYSCTDLFNGVCAANYLIKKDSKENNKKLINIDKSLYREMNDEEIFTLGDIEEIISMYVGKYLEDNNRDILCDESFILKNNVMRKKRSITKYIISYYNREITKNELETAIYKVISNNEVNLTKKKVS